MYKKYLEYIDAILENGSFTGASKDLYMSQSALSQFIKRIEDNLGVDILERGVNPCRLTDAGELYYESLKNIMTIEEDTINRIEDINNLRKGEVTIGSTEYLSYYILSNVLPKFNKLYPGININLVEDRTDKLDDSVLEGKSDFSITFKTSNSKKELTNIKLFEEEVFIAVPIHCELVEKLNLEYPQNGNFPTIDVSNLKNMNLIGSKKGQNLQFLFSELDAYTEYTLTRVLETESMALANKFVSKGLGITLIPKFMAFEKDSECIFLRINPSLRKRTIMIHYNPLRKLKKPAKILIDMIQEYVKENQLNIE